MVYIFNRFDNRSPVFVRRCSLLSLSSWIDLRMVPLFVSKELLNQSTILTLSELSYSIEDWITLKKFIKNAIFLLYNFLFSPIWFCSSLSICLNLLLYNLEYWIFSELYIILQKTFYGEFETNYIKILSLQFLNFLNEIFLLIIIL